jgi:hypothetical protein
MSARPPTGRRVSLHIEPGLASKIARSAIVVGEMEKLVHEIAAVAQATCPVAGPDEHLPKGHRPGELKASEEHGVILTPAGAVGVIAYAAFWSHMVHFGTRHAPPNPWLQNAALQVLVAHHTAVA